MNAKVGAQLRWRSSASALGISTLQSPPWTLMSRPGYSATSVSCSSFAFGRSLEVPQPRKAARVAGLERDAGRAVELLAGQPIDPESLARERIEVHGLRALAGGCAQKGGEIVGEDRELQTGPVAPRPTLMLAHASAGVSDLGISSQVRPSSTRPPLFGR